MQKISLQANTRTIFGKQVKSLRRQGLLPVTIYGKKIKSESLQVDAKDFAKTFKKVKETGLVDLKIGEKEGRPVLIHNLQKDPVSGLVLHADFYQVDLKEKVKTMVPVVATGDSRAVIDNKGVLLHILSEVEVEALPTDLPEKIEVDVSSLVDVDQTIFVKDLVLDKVKIEILTNQEEVVFKIGPLITKEMEEQLKQEEEAKAQAATQGETAAPQEGDQLPQEEKKDSSGEKPQDKPKSE
jgi:large subunit ribosomal protein L25